MAATKLADVIVPEIFNQYVVERTSELSAILQSGIAADVTERILSEMGGRTVNMPFFQDLSGDDEVIDDTADLTINKIDTEQDVAAVLIRGKVFGASDLSAELAGSDPMKAIGDLFAGYRARKLQSTLVSVLGGAMGASNMTANVHDISALSGAASNIDGEAFIDAVQCLGDQKAALTGVLMHSATETALAKLDLIDYVPDSEGKPTIPTYMGKRVIVDDGCPVSSGTYTTYLFGPGAIGFANGNVKYPVELGREALMGGGTDYLVNRWKVVLHPRGIKWNPGSGVPAKPTPSNTELAATGNWTRVYEPQNIRLVQFKHKLAS